ncbi:DNA sulfur modification protein DndB [Planomicrobium sp. HSC-17F08]|nr:DNA sulfur modification protein DndB [Planomicrobium sp. HSC-17F08]
MENIGVLATIQGSTYQQFGKEILSTQIRFSMLRAMFEVDHEVQRKLDPRRRGEIRNFIIEALEKEEHFYFSPFIFSSRNGITEVDGGFELVPGNKIYVLDGQHRSAALLSAISHLQGKKEQAELESDYMEAQKIQGFIQSLEAYPVAMQVYLDLNQQEERQLFTDYNTERQEAHTGLVMQYDQRDAYIELTREVAQALENKLDIETSRARLTYQNSAITSTAIMRKCLIALFEGLLTVKTGEPYYRNCKQAEVPKIAKHFFESWSGLFPRQMGNRKLYVSGLTGIQTALAYTVYTLTRNHPISHIEAIGMLKQLNRRCSWQHDDPMFAHMYDPSSGQIKNHSTITAVKKTMLEFLRAIEEEEFSA